MIVNMSIYEAIILVGLPGMGKTSIGKKITKEHPTIKGIEQDDFYINGKADHNAYVREIKRTVQHQHVILCKNHHTKESLQQVLDALQQIHVRYTIFNLVPKDISSMSKEERNNHINTLLDRIEKRTDGSSHLCIDHTHSRDRARQIIKHGFWKNYQEPEEPFIQLSYLDLIETNVKIIMSYLKIL
jgi:adenylate kinase family enzyme